MEKVGIIAEYNPFHNGHIYHLNKVKELFPNSIYILILIGNFTQRADASIINKWDKTKIALEYGYDLVIELPYNIATSSANLYAKGAIDILNILNCNYLVFGSESNDIELFKKIVNITNNNNYDIKIKKYLKEGYSYPKSLGLALNELSNINIYKPNDVLALEYVRNIINSKSKIIPISIKRTNEYDDNKIINNIASASFIRKNINNNIIKDLIPSISYKYIKKINYDDYFKFIKYKIISCNDLINILDMDDTILNRLKKQIHKSNNLNELILNTKTKKYTYNKIKRILLHILTDTKKDYNTNINYIRVLGFTSKGSKVLKEVKKLTNIPIITKYKKEYDYLFKDDIKASMLYSLLTDYDYKEDYKSSMKK